MDKKALRTMTYGVYIVGVKNGDSFGGCVIDALMQISSGDNPVFVMGLIKSSYTNELIKKHKEFSVSVVSEDVNPLDIAIFGFQSSRNADKWSQVDHTIHEGLPILTNSVSYLKLRLVDTVDLGTHDAFICEVDDAWLGSAPTALIYNNYQGEMQKESKEAFEELLQKRKLVNNMETKKYVCTVCMYEYDGDIPFEDLPDSYVCPVCGVPKSEFELQ